MGKYDGAKPKQVLKALKHDVVVTGYHNSSKSKEVKLYDPDEDTWRWVTAKKGYFVFDDKRSDPYVWKETYYVY